jgi:hypothetical protein
MIQGRDEVTILRRVYTGAVDEHGNGKPENEEITVTGVLISWGATGDTVTTISETITSAVTLYLPNGVETKNGDRFRLPDGSIWTKNGATINWTTPKGFRVKTRQIIELTKREG